MAGKMNDLTNLVQLLYHFTQSELAILLGDPTGTTISAPRLAACILNASSEIGNLLCMRYDVESFTILTPGNEILKFANDLVIYEMYADYMKGGSIPSSVVWRRISALSAIKKLASGVTELTHVEHEDWKLITSSVFNVTTSGRHFSNDDLDSYFGGIDD